MVGVDRLKVSSKLLSSVWIALGAPVAALGFAELSAGSEVCLVIELPVVFFVRSAVLSEVRVAMKA